MAENNEINEEYVKELEKELRDFEQKSEGDSKTLQLLVYPGMLAFVILATYGFYLIQSLSSDVHHMSMTIESMAGSVSKNMDSISKTMNNMSTHMNKLVVTTKSMSGDIGNMTHNIDAMDNTMSSLKSATYDMANSTHSMKNNMKSLDQNISTPLSFMNNFLPWTSNNNNRRFIPPITQPSYYTYPPLPNMGFQQPLVMPQKIMPLKPLAPLAPTVPAVTKGGNNQSSFSGGLLTDSKG
ncbi:MAG: hypothetical protein KAG28_10780 [Cocleimonas sp.]|nr:hypothetical protein [Cocleimonas sp.]